MAPFQNFFSKITKKIGENSKSIKKLLKMSEISKFFNFWAISTCNTSKESIFHIEFNFKQKNYDLFEEKVKKSNFFDFFFKIDADHLSSNVIFSNLCQKNLKLSLPVLWKRFEIKSHQRRACYLKPRRNGGPIPTGGGLEEPPPTLTRVKVPQYLVKGSLEFIKRSSGFLRFLQFPKDY